ncbi:MAG: hypothetical protein LBH76_00655, partial [Propionibacteriaceae bacterium]|nr:hypothetical protein [Propionibacteriaceae bacterium]
AGNEGQAESPSLVASSRPMTPQCRPGCGRSRPKSPPRPRRQGLPARLWPEYAPTYYGAFVRDPDSNNVEAVCLD